MHLVTCPTRLAVKPAVHGLPLNWSVSQSRRPGGRGVRVVHLPPTPPPQPPAVQISTVVTAGETVLFWFLQDSEGAQPLNLSAKPKASESKSPNSPPTSPQVPAAAAGATKLGHAGSGKHSAPSSIGGPPTRMSSIGKRNCLSILRESGCKVCVDRKQNYEKLQLLLI